MMRNAWLTLPYRVRSLHPCVRHISDGTFHTGFELDCALDLMRRLVAKLSDPHVRLVFSIESP
jgi:hypothetical protein